MNSDKERRFNMPLYDPDLYKEIDQVVGNTSEYIREYYVPLADSANVEDNNKCFALAVQLRKAGKKSLSYEVSKYLTEKHASLKSYNIYLASTYDLAITKAIEIDVLKIVFDAAWKFYAEEKFEPNITATLLKCCNYLIEFNEASETEFEEIYNKCPESERLNNSFIVTQYFKRLIAKKKYQQVIDIYMTLPLKLKNNKTLMRLRKSCENGNAFLDSRNVSANTNKRSNKITIISRSEYIESIAKILNNFSIDTNVVDINSIDIIESLNQSTYKSTIAILVIPKESTECDQIRWTFVLGYCVHKFSKNNMILFVEGGNKVETKFFPVILKMFEKFDYTSELDFVTKLGSLGIISG